MAFISPIRLLPPPPPPSDEDGGFGAGAAASPSSWIYKNTSRHYVQRNLSIDHENMDTKMIQHLCQTTSL